MWYVISAGRKTIDETCGVIEVITWKSQQNPVTSFDLSWDYCPNLMLCLVPQEVFERVQREIISKEMLTELENAEPFLAR